MKTHLDYFKEGFRIMHLRDPNPEELEAAAKEAGIWVNHMDRLQDSGMSEEQATTILDIIDERVTGRKAD